MSTATRNLLRHQAITLYGLRRNFGVPISLWRVINTVTALEAGSEVFTYGIYYIPRAIVLPGMQQRDFAYDLSYIAAAKNFTYGGFFDQNTRYVILNDEDRMGDSQTIIPVPSDTLLINDQVYSIRRVEHFEAQYLYMIECRTVENLPKVIKSYTASGDTDEFVDGDYYVNGLNATKPKYQTLDGRAFIWWDGTDSWIISEVAGTLGSIYWTRQDLVITGEYTPSEESRGKVTLT